MKILRMGGILKDGWGEMISEQSLGGFKTKLSNNEEKRRLFKKVKRRNESQKI